MKVNNIDEITDIFLDNKKKVFIHKNFIVNGDFIYYIDNATKFNVNTKEDEYLEEYHIYDNLIIDGDFHDTQYVELLIVGSVKIIGNSVNLCKDTTDVGR